MFGCSGLECIFQPTIAKPVKGGQLIASSTSASHVVQSRNSRDNDNELVAEPSPIKPQTQLRRKRCPFKACMYDTFGHPIYLVADSLTTGTKPQIRDSPEIKATPEPEKVVEVSQQPLPPTKEPEQSIIDDPPFSLSLCLSDALTCTADEKTTNPPISTGENKSVLPDLNEFERNAQILKQLGILHLQDKATRPRLPQETDEHILREAGLAQHLEVRDDLSESGATVIIMDRVAKNRRYVELMSDREMQILKEAGVVIHDSRDKSHGSYGKDANLLDDLTVTTVGLTCGTKTLGPSESYVTSNTTIASTVYGLNGKEMQGVNNTYAEKELLRRLNNGWQRIGDDCTECGMPIIFTMDGGEVLMECVICGMLGSNQVLNNAEGIQESFSNMGTTITSRMSMNDWQGVNKAMQSPSSHGITSQDSTVFFKNHQVVLPSCEQSIIEKCKSDLASLDDDEFKKELGKRIFAGWTLVGLNCPSCNLPLISESKGGVAICLRCL